MRDRAGQGRLGAALLLASLVSLSCDKPDPPREKASEASPSAGESVLTAEPSAAAASASEKPSAVELSKFPELSIFELEGKWKTQTGEEIELKDLEGTVFVLVMIYTSCKAACPRLIADMRGIQREVSKRGEEDVKYVFVSIDPRNDTSEKLMALAKDVKMTEDRWLFLQGTEEGVRYLANVLAVKYKKISPLDFSHSNIISVFNKKGVLAHQQEGLSTKNKKTVDSIVELAAL